MVNVPASGAMEALGRARARVDMPAGRAGLRAVSSRDLDQPAALPGKLVVKHLDQESPAGSEDSPGEPGIGADHVPDLKTLDDHRAVAFGIGARERVQAVLALPPDLAMQPVDAIDGFLSLPGSFLAARDDALSTSKSFQGAFEVGRVRYQRPIGVGEQIAEAAVERDDGFRLGCRFRHFELTENRGEPLVAFPPHSARFRRALEWPVEDGLEIAQLGKPQDFAVEAPDLRVRLGKTEEVTPFSLPAGRLRQLFETALPGLVEFDKKLGTDVTRHIGEPRQLRAYIFELVDLIEGSKEDPFLANASKAHSSLLEGNVPEEAQRTFPSQKPSLLRWRRVHAVPKCLAHEHKANDSLRSFAGKRVLYSERQTMSALKFPRRRILRRSPWQCREPAFPTTPRRGFISNLKDGVSAPEM